ncbi:MAG: toll/interleukin-1 receptor domain-containing protein [Hyphomonadaceae bacterium]|nr:toll/interleukin-1 receptor domain-containing protein [Hyphomonadaceae bacterium]
MADVFLSYAREDRAKAAQIAEALTAGGYDVFWDVEIPPGVTWSDFLQEKLANCKAALVLWSKTSTASQWVREEARLAKDKSKLIPVMIDDSAPPFGFGEIQAANLAAWNGAADDPQWKLLLSGVARAVGAQPTGTAAAAPIRPAASAGWGAAQGGAASTPAAGADGKKKPNVPLIIGAAVAGTIVVLAVIGSMSGTGSVQGPPPPPAPIGPSAPSTAELSPALRAIVEQARSAQAAGRAASERASAAAVEGNRAAMQAAQNVGGFGQIQTDPVTWVTGDLAALQQGRPGAVTMKNTQLGTTFVGVLELDMSTGLMRQLTGAFDNGRGGSGLGQLQLDGQNGRSAGRDTTPAYTSEGQGQGVAGAYETTAIGVVTFADGRRYEGQYVTRGRDAALLRHGLGVTYAANGAVGESGRFDNDKLVAPE